MKTSTVFALLLVTGLFAACNKNSDTTIPPVTRQVDTLSGSISSNITLDAGRDYLVNGRLFIKNNASLTIPAGITVYMAKKDAAADKSSLIVTKGSRIFISGTADKPVVFTSNATSKAPGDWGAIVLLGKAATNTGTGNAAGLAVSADTEYGGTTADDNSGSISYLRLEYSGGINPDAEDEWAVDKVSGFCLESVGYGTTIDHVMVTHSNDDGFQFVGGTVNATHLVAFNNGDDDFDFDLGYTGKLQYLISYRTALSSNHALRANAFESYNDEVPTLNLPLTRPVISNMTIIGPQGNETVHTNLNQGVYIRKGTRFVMQNSIIAEYPQGGLMVCPRTRPVLLLNTGSIFKYNLAHSDSLDKTFSYDHGSDPLGFYGIFADPQLKDFALDSMNQNQLIVSAADLKLAGMYNANTPDFTPLPASPALTGANFDGADFSTFFTVVAYKGAIGSQNWAAAGNWAVWK